jgi:hypothetical protein
MEDEELDRLILLLVRSGREVFLLRLRDLAIYGTQTHAHPTSDHQGHEVDLDGVFGVDRDCRLSKHLSRTLAFFREDKAA